MTEEEHLSRAVAAKQFLASSVYASVRDELKAEFTASIVHSDFMDTETREANFRLIRAFDLLEAELQARALVGDTLRQRAELQQIEEDIERG